MNQFSTKRTSSSYCSIDDDFKEEEIRSAQHRNGPNLLPSASRSSRNVLLPTRSVSSPPQKNSDAQSPHHQLSKSLNITLNISNNQHSAPLWFTVGDKLDVLQEKGEWYRGEVTQLDGYSLGVHFEHSSGRSFKWIKDCNHIFRVICLCPKQCHSASHLVAPLGAQTNYSYDEQVTLWDAHSLRFHAVVHSVLLKYIGCNLRDAVAAASDFRLVPMEQAVSSSKNMSQLLEQHRALDTQMTADFERAAQRQQNAATNTATLGQYIRYIKSCDGSKVQQAMGRQNEDIQSVDAALSDNERQIEVLLERQRQLKAKRESMGQR